MKYLLFISLSLAIFFHPSLSYSKHAILRCNHNKIIRIGDYKAEVLEKCGQPFFREENYVVNQWSYKLGPRNKIWVIAFKNGKVDEINNSDQGSNATIGKTEKKPQIESDFHKVRCGKQFVRLGDFKASVLDFCGTPFLKEENRLTDQWSYHFGPEETLYVISFAKGKVIAINKELKRKSKPSLAGHK